MMAIVLLSGKQGSGKTTLSSRLFARFYVKRPEIKVIEIKFAEAIYAMHDKCLELMRTYGVETPEIDGRLLQLLGTEWGRKHYGEDVWVNVLRNKIESLVRYNPEGQWLFVVSDCRFKNEFDAFPEALRVRLVASEEVRKERAEKWRETVNHPSEIDLDEYSAAGKFDLYLDTERTPIEGCLSLVLAQLEKGSWVERRGR